MDEQEIISYCFDYNRVPICPTLSMDAGECNDPTCRFSSEDIYFTCYVSVEREILEDLDALFDYLCEYVRANPEALVSIVPDQEAEVRRDLNQISDLVEEMKEFERGQIDDAYKCPYITETGNCLFGPVCEFLCTEVEDDRIAVFERQQEWYPAHKDCTCCYGYKFGCQVCNGACVSCE